MSLLQVSELGISFGDKEVLRDVSFRIDERDRIGLVGRNGAGKSTLLRLIAGTETPERGQIHRKRGLTVAWLEQIEAPSPGESVLGRAMQAFADLEEMERELRALEGRLGDGDPAVLERYGLLHERWERRGAYRAEAEAKKVLAGLGFRESTFDQTVASLSGGERTRLGLARLLLEAPDLLLLDEPTNHLDLDAAEFLEGWVQRYPGGVVIASHDRAFLDAAVDRIAAIEARRLQVYNGNYSAYLEQREAARQRQAELYERQQAEIARTEEFIRRNIAGQATKQAQARRKALARMERVEAVSHERSAAIQLGEAQPSSRNVLSVEDLEVRIGERRLLAPTNFQILRGERVGIVGPNGAGKSTLLKVLLGKLAPAAGWVQMGGKVRVAYLDQELSVVDSRRSVLEELALSAPTAPTEQLRAHAGRFLFSGDEAERKIATFSGGERARACLAKLTLTGCNLLVLDEPTNHLDAASREALEDALDDFGGTLLCVSHDRWFLERTCERIFWLQHSEGDAAFRLEDYRCSFTEARERYAAAMEQAASVTERPAAEDARAAHERRRAEANARKAAERRAAAIAKELEPLEARLDALEQRLADPALATDYVELGKLQEEKDALEERILTLLEERETLEASIAS